MHVVGIVLVVLAVLALIFALLQRHQANKIAGAPFHKTGELASNPTLGGGKGLVSAEGSAQPHTQFFAPCSGQPCVYFEVKVERLWEKQVKTENGYKTERGSTVLRTDKAGTTFLLNDSSGPVVVDARESVTAPLKESFGQTQNVAYGDVMFGHYRTHIPPHSGAEHSTGVKVTERIFAPTGMIYAMGKLAQGAITKTDGMLGGLEIHEGGREQILGRSSRNAKVGFILAAVMFVPGIVGTLFFSGGPSAPDASACVAGITDTTTAPCVDRLFNDDGKTYPWKVTKGAIYDVNVAPPAEAKIALNPAITVKDATGTVVFAGENDARHSLPAGSYTITVRDETKGRAATMSGGFGYALKITSTPDVASPAASSAPPAASSPPPAATTTAHPDDHGTPPSKAAGKGKHKH